MRFWCLLISLCCCLFLLNGCDARSEPEASKIGSISVLNREISDIIAYGVGPVLENRNPTEEEILTYGEGHCGMYAYLLAKRLSMQGVESHTIDILRYDGGAHSVVEVDLDGKVYTFDPTLGIYYRAAVRELLDNPNFELLKVGEPVQLPEYASATFWSGVRQLVYYDDVRDCYDYDLTANDTYVVYGNSNLSGFLDGTVVAYQENEIPFIQIEFDDIQSLYRLKIYWVSPPEEPLAIQIEAIGIDGSARPLFDSKALAGSVCFSYTLPSKITTKSICISFPDAVPEIARLQIFE